ncbi:high nitrogen upregulated cytochrome P450 monooxygenase 2 [Gloeopeniophorella convolvens]|nr:high nitrogen upregulated cytochrome P450 monooxygenase 2 [Gloeopeniophorella convolvens]
MFSPSPDNIQSFLESLSITDAAVIVSQCSLTPLFILLVLVPSSIAYAFAFSPLSGFHVVTATFAFYYGLILLCATAYRLSAWHPLAQYPGPYLARLSKVWLAIIAAGGKQHIHFRKLHERYGDIVRVGPNELSIRDASIIPSLLGPGGPEKGPFWDGRTEPDSLIVLRNHAEHARARKAWDRALSSKALKEYDVIIARRVRQLVGHFESMIKQQRGQAPGKACCTLDMSSWLSFFATDFMGDMAFGGGFELMADRGDKENVWTTIAQGVTAIGTLAHISWFLPVINAIAPGVKLLSAFGSRQADRRLKMDASRKDLFYYLDKVAQQGVLAIIAGSDTTSTTSSALMYYLVQNPAAYERLQNEVDAAFPSADEPLDVSKLSELEWLNACINEALRLQPPVPSGNHRFVPRGNGPRRFGMHVIPEQTQVAIHTYSIQRDPRNFYDEDSFLPQRWLATDKPAGVHNPNAFIPFSYGPFGCAGKSLALMEMRMLACWLIRRFHFSATPGTDVSAWEEGLKDRFVLLRDPLMLDVSLRE